MRHGVLPRTLHVDEPSPQVDWSAGAVELLTEAGAVAARPDRPRRAGVSSFGISGTNAHVILEQAAAERRRQRRAERRPGGAGRACRWLLSGAVGAEALRAQAGRLPTHLDRAPGLDPPDVGLLAGHRPAPRSSTGRSSSAADRDALLAGAGRAGRAAGTRARRRHRRRRRRRPVAFLFTGQGASGSAWAASCTTRFPVFADALRRGLRRSSTRMLDRPLREVLFGDGRRRRWTGPAYTQPALFAVEVALSGCWSRWGVRPDVAGRPLDRRARRRARRRRAVARGRRRAGRRPRPADAGAAGGRRDGRASQAAEAADAGAAGRPDGGRVAAVNGPRVGGGLRRRRTRVRRARRAAVPRRGREARRLHGQPRVPLAADGADARRVPRRSLDGLALQPRRRSRSSPTLTGAAGHGRGARPPDYWVGTSASRCGSPTPSRPLRDAGRRTFLELGPDAVLTRRWPADCLGPDAGSVGRRAPRAADQRRAPRRCSPRWPSARPRRAVDWAALLRRHAARRVDLPTYAFQHERYWLDAPPAPATSPGRASARPTTRCSAPRSTSPTATASCSPAGCPLRTHPWLADHAVCGTVAAARHRAASSWPCAPATRSAAAGRRADPPGPAGAPGDGRACSSRSPSRAADEPAGGRSSVHSRGPTTDDAVDPARHRRPDRRRTRAGTARAGRRVAAGRTPTRSTSTASTTAWPTRASTTARRSRACARPGGAATTVFAEVALPDEHADAGRLRPAPGAARRRPARASRSAWPATHGRAAGRAAVRLDRRRLHAAGATALRVRLAPARGRHRGWRWPTPTGTPVAAVGRCVRARSRRPARRRGVRARSPMHCAGRRPRRPERRDLGGARRRRAGRRRRADVTADLADGRRPPTRLPSLPVAAPRTTPRTAPAAVREPLRRDALAPSRTGWPTSGAPTRCWWSASAGRRRLGRRRRAGAWSGPRRPSTRAGSSWSTPTTAPARPAPRWPPPGRRRAAARRARRRARVPRLARPRRTGRRRAPAVRPGRHRAGHRRHRRARRAWSPGTWSPGTASGTSLLTSRRGPDAPGAAELAAELTGLGAEVDGRRLRRRRPRRAAPRCWPASRAPADRRGPRRRRPGRRRCSTSLTPERLDTVLRPKVDAAWHLHELTRDRTWRAFVLFSSAAGVLGSAGPGQLRRRQHLPRRARRPPARRRACPATSLAWGLWDRQRHGGRLADADLRRIARGGIGAADRPTRAGAVRRGARRRRRAARGRRVDWPPLATAPDRGACRRCCGPSLRAAARGRRPRGADAGRDRAAERLAGLAGGRPRAARCSTWSAPQVAAVLGHADAGGDRRRTGPSTSWASTR